MNRLTQYLLRHFRPRFYGFLTKIFYSSKEISFGTNLKTDSIPKIIIDKGCKLKFGNNVELRRSVEIRVHNSAEIIIENNVRIDRGVRLLAANNAIITISNGVRIGLYTVLNGGDSIYIGEKSLVSGFVYLQTSMHGYKNKDLLVQDQGYEHAPIILEKGTWLGTHVVVLPGVIIMEGAVVGSNAVVTKNVNQFEVVAGIPAKPLKKRE